APLLPTLNSTALLVKAWAREFGPGTTVIVNGALVGSTGETPLSLRLGTDACKAVASTVTVTPWIVSALGPLLVSTSLRDGLQVMAPSLPTLNSTALLVKAWAREFGPGRTVIVNGVLVGSTADSMLRVRLGTDAWSAVASTVTVTPL